MKIAMNVEKIIGLRKWDIMTEKKVIKFGDKYIFSIFVDEKGRATKLLCNNKDISFLDALKIVAEYEEEEKLRIKKYMEEKRINNDYPRARK